MKNNNLSIRFWAEEDKPREKLMLKGRSALTAAELIAILIGSGSASQSAVSLAKTILQHYDNDLERLGRANFSELIKFSGIGEAKAVSIIAGMELGKRRRMSSPGKRLKITSSQNAYEAACPIMDDLPHEVFNILILNRANYLIRIETISTGGIAGTVVDPKILFKKALDHHASSIILCHNHPSGNLKPSTQDIEITQRLVKAGKLLEIMILDHLIIAEGGYYSFADEGKI